jgi:hypothetical protein
MQKQKEVMKKDRTVPQNRSKGLHWGSILMALGVYFMNIRHQSTQNAMVRGVDHFRLIVTGFLISTTQGAIEAVELYL